MSQHECPCDWCTRMRATPPRSFADEVDRFVKESWLAANPEYAPKARPDVAAGSRGGVRVSTSTHPTAPDLARARLVRCERLSCELSVSACVQRHRRGLRLLGRNGLTREVPAPEATITCARCPDGAERAKGVT